ncbi:PREDICTED: collagen alpha-1(I) chain-like [Sturnus vulgaris]|uniref:collagen alpha-1(I) chain-like n=1 Tax=Sturnus vulgaris TaxID=9172 RepID=UPI00071A5F87|nr:PREDICTED: collagen alpha-1(I) chain-like [Sturnus vulgaris]
MTPVGDHGVQRAATGRSEGGEEPQSLGQHVTDMGKPTGAYSTGECERQSSCSHTTDGSPGHEAHPGLCTGGSASPDTAGLTVPDTSPRQSHVRRLGAGNAAGALAVCIGCVRGAGATRGLASFPPPGRRDAARRRFPTRPGAELRSPAPKDEPPVDSDLAGAVEGRSGAEARAARRGTPPGGSGGRGDGRGSLEWPAVRSGQPRPGGCPEPDNDSRGPSGQCRDTGARRRPGCSGASPALAFTDKAPRPLQPQLRPWHCTGHQRPEPAHRRARHDARTPRRTGSARAGPPGAWWGAADRAAKAAQSRASDRGPRQEPPQPSTQPPAPAFPPAAGYGRFPPARAYLAGPFSGPLRGTRPGSAPRRVPGSRRERALGRGGPSPGGGGGFSPGRAETALGTRGSPAPAPGAPRARPRRSPLAVTPPRPAPPGRPPPPWPHPPAFAIGDLLPRSRPCCRLIGLQAPAPPRAPRSACPIGARRCHSARRGGEAAAGSVDAVRGGRAAAAPAGRAALRAEGRGRRGAIARRGATPASGHVAERRGGAGGGREVWAEGGAGRLRGGARAGPAARHVRARGCRRGGGWARGPVTAETAPPRAGPAGPRPWSPEQRPRDREAEGWPLRGRRGCRAGQEGPRGARCPLSAEGLNPVPVPVYRGCGRSQ